MGTAQLSSPYGIANKTRQFVQDKSTAIVREAWDNGIREFDTAQGYGESERVLGRALSELEITGKACIISKLQPPVGSLEY